MPQEDYRKHAEAPVPEAEVQRIMAELRLDYVQARNHVKVLIALRLRSVRQRTDTGVSRA